MRSIYSVVAALAASSMLLAACGSNDRCLDAPNPTECRQWRDAGGDVDDYLMYGMAGYMLGSAMSGGRRVIVIKQDPHYRGTRHSLRRPIPSASQQVSSYERRQRAAVAERARAVEAAKNREQARKQESVRQMKTYGSNRTSSDRRSFSSSSSRSFGSSSRSFGSSRRR